MVSRLTIPNAKLNRLNAQDAIIENLTVKNLDVINSEPDQNSDIDPGIGPGGQTEGNLYGAIVVGSGPAGCTAAIRVADELKKKGINKKVALISPGYLQTNDQAYAINPYPNLLPKDLILPYSNYSGKEATILQVAGESIATAESLIISEGNSQIYQIYQTSITTVTENNLKLGLLPDIRDIGGLGNINGNVAVLDPVLYDQTNFEGHTGLSSSNNEFNYKNEYYQTLEISNYVNYITKNAKINGKSIYTNLDETGIPPDAMDSVKTQINLENAFIESVNNSANLTLSPSGALEPADNYMVCSRINWSLEILNRSDYIDLYQNMQVDRLLLENNLTKCIGIISQNRKVFGDNVIISSGMTGSTNILQRTAVLSTIPRQISNNNFKTSIFKTEPGQRTGFEAPGLNVIGVLPNITEEFIPASKSLYSNIDAVYIDGTNGVCEQYGLLQFNFDGDFDIIELFMVLFSVSREEAELFTVLFGLVGQKTNASGSYTGRALMMVAIIYAPIKYVQYLENSTGPTKLYTYDGQPNEALQNKGTSISSLSEDDNNLAITRADIGREIQFNFGNFKPGTPETIIDEYYESFRILINEFYFNENSVYKFLMNKISSTPDTPAFVLEESSQLFFFGPTNKENLTNDQISSTFSTLWHSTRTNNLFVDDKTLKLNEIENVYGGDQSFNPLYFPTSTQILSQCTAVRAANSVVNNILNEEKISSETENLITY